MTRQKAVVRQYWSRRTISECTDMTSGGHEVVTASCDLFMLCRVVILLQSHHNRVHWLPFTHKDICSSIPR